MSNKVIIWILGSLSCGKTVQNKLFQKHWGNGEREYKTDGATYAYTTYGDICSLGDLNESTCSGLDRVTTKIKTEGVFDSLDRALEECDIVVVESIMSASTWFEKLQDCDAKLFMVHISISFEENVRRLKKRKAEKDPRSELTEYGYLNIELTDSNYEFIRKTRMQYQNIYDKYKDECNSLWLECSDLEPERINRKIMTFIHQLL